MPTDRERAIEYRKAAARCLRMASDATMPENRDYWVTQAQFWHGLALQFEGATAGLEDQFPMFPPAAWKSNQPHARADA